MGFNCERAATFYLNKVDSAQVLLDASNFMVWINVGYLPGLALSLYAGFPSWETFSGSLLLHIMEKKAQEKDIITSFLV